MHIIMAAFGISLCLFYLNSAKLERRDSGPRPSSGAKLRTNAAIFTSAALPLPWLFQPTTEAWRAAAATRHFNLLNAWAWYEWLGVIAPFVILYYFARQARNEADNDRNPNSPLAPDSPLLFFITPSSSWQSRYSSCSRPN